MSGPRWYGFDGDRLREVTAEDAGSGRFQYVFATPFGLTDATRDSLESLFRTGRP